MKPTLYLYYYGKTEVKGQETVCLLTELFFSAEMNRHHISKQELVQKPASGTIGRRQPQILDTCGKSHSIRRQDYHMKGITCTRKK